MKNKVLLISIFVVLLLASCSTMNVAVINHEPVSEVSSMAVLPVNFSERSLPTLPLIDAGIYNTAANSVVTQTQEIEDNAEQEITDSVVSLLSEKSGLDVQVIESGYPEFNFDTESYAWAASLAEENGVDVVVVPNIKVNTRSVGSFGIKGGSTLDMTLDFVSADGTLLVEGLFVTSAVVAGPKDLANYLSLVNSYQIFVPQLIDKIYEL